MEGAVIEMLNKLQRREILNSQFYNPTARIHPRTPHVTLLSSYQITLNSLPQGATRHKS